MTHCDFSARSARDEIRHIVGSSQPDVIIGSDKDQNRGCKKEDNDHIEFLCKLYGAQVSRGRYFVHELTSEVNSRMKCVTKIMAMPGNKNGRGRSVHVCAGRVRRGGPGFVNVCARTTRDELGCGCKKQMREGAQTRSG